MINVSEIVNDLYIGIIYELNFNFIIEYVHFGSIFIAIKNGSIKSTKMLKMILFVKKGSVRRQEDTVVYQFWI